MFYACMRMRFSSVVFVLNVESIVLTPVEDSVVGPYQRPYTMTCRGQNIRTWQWIHNNAILRNSSDGRVQVWSRGQIHFTSLQYGDSGVYYCKTGNHFESNVYATYRLTVNGMYVCIMYYKCLCMRVRVRVCVCVCVRIT